jgi:hypothetical protein
MIARNGVTVWLVGVGSACVVGVVMLLVTDKRTTTPWWASALALSSGWVAAVIAAGDQRWGRTAAPAGALNITALVHALAVGWTLPAVALVVAACLVSAAHVWRQAQRA